jgi:hypothetical protein
MRARTIDTLRHKCRRDRRVICATVHAHQLRARQRQRYSRANAPSTSGLARGSTDSGSVHSEQTCTRQLCAQSHYTRMHRDTTLTHVHVNTPVCASVIGVSWQLHRCECGQRRRRAACAARRTARRRLGAERQLDAAVGTSRCQLLHHGAAHETGLQRTRARSHSRTSTRAVRSSVSAWARRCSSCSTARNCGAAF